MPAQKLQAALSAVDWNGNVAALLGNAAHVESLANTNLRLAVWARQLEGADTGNPALRFVREMQMAGQYVTALLGLALYKPAAASMRTVLESALYYSFFNSHPSELATLVRDERYYVSKRDILEYHKDHTPAYNKKQNILGLGQNLDSWYSEISAVIHGQIPGAWISTTSIKDTKINTTALDKAVESFVTCEDLVRKFFLCTCAPPLWHAFSTPSKQSFLKGLSGDQKTVLGLSQA